MAEVGFERNRSRYLAMLDAAGHAGLITMEAEVEPQNGELILKHSQDVEPILDRNREWQTHYPDGRTLGGGFSYAATIPDIVIMQWKKLGIDIFDNNDTAKILRMLNDPEWRYLRTGLGRL